MSWIISLHFRDLGSSFQCLIQASSGLTAFSWKSPSWQPFPVHMTFDVCHLNVSTFCERHCPERSPLVSAVGWLPLRLGKLSSTAVIKNNHFHSWVSGKLRISDSIWGKEKTGGRKEKLQNHFLLATGKTDISASTSVRWGWRIAKAAYKQQIDQTYLCYSSIIKGVIPQIYLALYVQQTTQHIYSL